ncbi:MAG: cupredoxin domain-containing protein [Cellulomonadaceae bacterium]
MTSVVGRVCALSAAILLLAGCGPSAPSQPAAPTLEPDGVYRVEVLMRDMRFVPDRVEVPSGAHLVLELRNVEGMEHDLVLEDGRASSVLTRDEEETFDIGPVTETIDGWCGIDTHRQSGMVLTIAPAPDGATS